jgi:hypothetical protein
VTREQLRLVLGNLGELVLKCFDDAGVKRTPALTQQGAVGGVLHKCVFEQIGRMWWHSLPKQQTCRHEPVERRLEFRLRPADYCRQQSMRELSSDHRSDLRDFLRLTKPIKPRHQGGVQACGDCTSVRWSVPLPLHAGAELYATSAASSLSSFAFRLSIGYSALSVVLRRAEVA